MKSKIKILTILTAMVMLLMSLASCSASDTLTKFPEILNETEIPATIKELIYEKTRGYCFVVLETDKDDATLQFRVNKSFFEEESVKIGNEMNIVCKTEKYLDGEKVNYYFQGEKLDYPFVDRKNGTVPVTIENAETYSVSLGRGFRTAYKFTFKDFEGNEFTAYDVPYELWESLYVQQVLCLREEENTAIVKTYSYAYYLDDLELFTV